MSAFSRSLLTLACASSVAVLAGCAAEDSAPVASDASTVDAVDVAASATEEAHEEDAQPQPSIEAAGPNPTLPAGFKPGAADSGAPADPKPNTQDVAKDTASTSAASGIEKCVYRKDRVRSEGNPADVPSTVSGTVHKVEAGDLDGGEPGIVLPEYASEEVWVLVLDAPTTLSGFKSGSPKQETETYAGKECIGLLEKGAWAGYEGKHVTLPFDPDRGWWQSDVSVPMGGLRVDYTPDEVQ